MKLSLFLPLLFIGFILFLSCDIQTFSGPITEEVRSADPYEAVHLKGAMNVVLDPSLDNEVRISAPEDAMSHIVTEVKGGELVIDLDVNAIVQDNITITIAEDELNEVRISGSGNFKGELEPVRKLDLRVSGSGDINVEVDTESLMVGVAGSGDVRCEGKSDLVKVSVDGSGDVDLEFLEVQEAVASVSGSGDIKLNVSKSLKANVSGSGDISYKGNPEQVDKNVSGSGDVTSLKP